MINESKISHKILELENSNLTGSNREEKKRKEKKIKKRKEKKIIGKKRTTNIILGKKVR